MINDEFSMPDKSSHLRSALPSKAKARTIFDQTVNMPEHQKAPIDGRDADETEGKTDRICTLASGSYS
jgi:hypothetical protein